MNRRFFLSTLTAVGGVVLLSRLPSWAQADDLRLSDRERISPHPSPLPRDERTKAKGIQKVIKPDAEWKQQLTPEQYNVLRQEGTEYAYSSPLNDIHDKGIFECAGCELPVFSSEQKFDSGTGWPSFWAPIKKENVIEAVDKSLGVTRTKVSCARCDGHLGHVFDDGPRPTGLRYCMNGVALRFVKQS